MDMWYFDGFVIIFIRATESGKKHSKVKYLKIKVIHTKATNFYAAVCGLYIYE